jgi:hypothetical protein
VEALDLLDPRAPGDRDVAFGPDRREVPLVGGERLERPARDPVALGPRRRAVGVEDEQRGVVRPPVADDRGLADEPPGALELRLDVRGRNVLSTSPRRRIICSPEAKPAPPIAAPSLPRSFVRAVNRFWSRFAASPALNPWAVMVAMLAPTWSSPTPSPAACGSTAPISDASCSNERTPRSTVLNRTSLTRPAARARSR